MISGRCAGTEFSITKTVHGSVGFTAPKTSETDWQTLRYAALRYSYLILKGETLGGKELADRILKEHTNNDSDTELPSSLADVIHTLERY